MRILHTVEFYAPSTGGAQEVVKQISERMVQAGHHVTVATSKLPERKDSIINGVNIVEFDIRGNEVVGMKGEVDEYKNFLIDNNFDVMMNYAAQQWATDLTLQCLDKISIKKFIAPCGYSALKNPDFNNYFSRLPALLRKYDGSIYLTKRYRDYTFARRHFIRKLHVIPNGADENEFRSTKSAMDFRKKFSISGFFLLSIGNHTGAKGHAETIHVFEKLPFPATLVIIGSKQRDGCYEDCEVLAEKINDIGKNKQVLLLNVPRETTLSALKSADLFLFLSNVESGPIVLIEAAAAGLPFISSKVGQAKEIARKTQGGLITSVRPDKLHDGNVFADIDQTVRLVEKLYNNNKMRSRLGNAGRENWAKNYSWQRVAEQYIDLYEKALK